MARGPEFPASANSPEQLIAERPGKAYFGTDGERPGLENRQSCRFIPRLALGAQLLGLLAI